MYDFAMEHPIVLLLIIWVVLHVARSFWIRTLRAIMVSRNGWPPAHLDADGDWKPLPRFDGSDD